MKKYMIISVAVLSMVFLTAGMAHAEGFSSPGELFAGEWTIGAGVYARSSAYVGGDSEVLPLPNISYTGKRLRIRGPVADVKLYGWESGAVKGEIAARLGWEFGGYDASDSAYLAGMSDRDGTLHGGVALTLKTRYVNLETSVMADLISEHEGFMAQAILKKMIPLHERWFITPSAGVVWKSSDMADYYYGVLPGEARIGRPAYAPGSVLNYRVGLNNIFVLTERWSLAAGARVEFFDSDVKDSPIVDDSFEWSVFTGVQYKF